MEITCYRDTKVASESLFLPAATYNLAHTLLARSPSGCLFVPIRTMQYLAILDAEEFVFLDGERKCWIDIAWQNFRPQVRSSLEDPVPYRADYYRPDTMQLKSRLQGELPRALKEIAAKGRLDGSAKVLKFPASVHPEFPQP
ncbi:MAG: hypothetical protein ABII63_07840 [Pseudomonadota bacterium]